MLLRTPRTDVEGIVEIGVFCSLIVHYLSKN